MRTEVTAEQSSGVEPEVVPSAGAGEGVDIGSSHAREATSVASGAIAGAVAGAVAGPLAAVAGGLIGSVIGVAAGIALGDDQRTRAAREESSDDDAREASGPGDSDVWSTVDGELDSELDLPIEFEETMPGSSRF